MDIYLLLVHIPIMNVNTSITTMEVIIYVNQEDSKRGYSRNLHAQIHLLLTWNGPVVLFHSGCWFHGGTGPSHRRPKHPQMRSSLVGRDNVGQETVGRDRSLYG
jgi:hypothetical protein